jgi:hypothetical protein
MSGSENLYLVMGCFGRCDDSFISCRGVENRILKIDESLVYYDDIMVYFESIRLFDRPLFDQNAIRHFIFNMQERYDQKIKRLWVEKQFHLFEKFIIAHKSCGVYIKLILVNVDADIKDEPLPEIKIPVKGMPETNHANETPTKLRVIRGRNT